MSKAQWYIICAALIVLLTCVRPAPDAEGKRRAADEMIKTLREELNG